MDPLTELEAELEAEKDIIREKKDTLTNENKILRKKAA
jgi:hypothetical protein